jgi:hypothetical protein
MTLSEGAVDFIDDARLTSLLEVPPAEPSRLREIMAKSLAKEALSVEETAALLSTNDPEIVEELFETARQLKRNVYGNRIVLFAPLYIGNDCVNDCLYCAFKRTNRDVVRRTLDEAEIQKQVEALENKGHKRLILVFGEHPRYDAEFIAACVRKVYSIRVNHGQIRRVNINAAPMDHEGYRIVKEAGIGTYQIFQETIITKLTASIIRRERAKEIFSIGWTACPARSKRGATTWALARCSDFMIGASKCLAWSLTRSTCRAAMASARIRSAFHACAPRPGFN